MSNYTNHKKSQISLSLSLSLSLFYPFFDFFLMFWLMDKFLCNLWKARTTNHLSVMSAIKVSQGQPDFVSNWQNPLIICLLSVFSVNLCFVCDLNVLQLLVGCTLYSYVFFVWLSLYQSLLLSFVYLSFIWMSVYFIVKSECQLSLLTTHQQLIIIDFLYKASMCKKDEKIECQYHMDHGVIWKVGACAHPSQRVSLDLLMRRSPHESAFCAIAWAFVMIERVTLVQQLNGKALLQ